MRVSQTHPSQAVLHLHTSWQRGFSSAMAHHQAGPHNPLCPSSRRGGGVAHGPVVRSHAHSLPKRVRRLGLQCALSAKAWERRLVVVDSLRPSEPKTVGAPQPACQTCVAHVHRGSGKAWVDRAASDDMLRACCAPSASCLRSCPPGLQKVMAGHLDALLPDAPRRSALLCDSSMEGEDGGCVAGALHVCFAFACGAANCWYSYFE